MEHLYLFAVLLFILSGLLSAAATRAESRYSAFGSKMSFFGASSLCAVLLAGRGYMSGTWGFAGFFDGVLLTISIIAVLYAILERRFDSPMDPGVLSVVALVLALIGASRGGVSEAPSYEVAGHVMLMFVSLAAFSISFFFSIVFIVQDHLLKRKRIGRLFFRLAPLELTGKLNFLFLTLGTASMLAGLVLGIVLASAEGAHSVWNEPTTWLSGVLLAAYFVILVGRVGPLERSRGIAYVAIANYAILLLTFALAHSAGGGR